TTTSVAGLSEGGPMVGFHEEAIMTASDSSVAGYAIARMIVEVFRQPDSHIGFLTLGSTMGQWLSLPMLIIGVGMIIWGSRRTA
ncbi:MAG: prolipoprotein diacylglyceryl transferase, partial [Alphaproteobacteria bacterium]|nr:prolipoprotein diacylglyceryl transferase [Alphaproteobacteria bacterium]